MIFYRRSKNNTTSRQTTLINFNLIMTSYLSIKKYITAYKSSSFMFPTLLMSGCNKCFKSTAVYAIRFNCWDVRTCIFSSLSYFFSSISWRFYFPFFYYYSSSSPPPLPSLWFFSRCKGRDHFQFLRGGNLNLVVAFFIVFLEIEMTRQNRCHVVTIEYFLLFYSVPFCRQVQTIFSPSSFWRFCGNVRDNVLKTAHTQCVFPFHLVIHFLYCWIMT